MSYAFWRKCDFQIHTPRDPNWTGVRPIGLGETVEETGQPANEQDVHAGRRAWAREFVDSCVSRGLEAIALTDHHEMVMVPYVQAEIAQRREADPGFNLWLFPGMELTTAGGKQCLILFDADLSEEWWRQAQGKLGIEYAAQEEMASKGPKVTQLACNYADIADQLNEVSGLRRRYIVLPNVSQGNKHTVLVEGAHTDFRRMPYVGGYLDAGQTLASIGSKNRTRLSGGDKTWSLREIYPIPTSDTRSADYATLGSNDTWIKLAASTAEAIRQAFLGHQSRIHIGPPATPALFIAEVRVNGSTILNDTALSLSSELNSAIGGRGSGKSSFLEYVAFGLGRSCYDMPRDHYSGTARMHDLVNDSIISKGASVSLTVSQDGAEFKVTRGQGTSYAPKVTYPNGSEQTITVQELRSLFPAVVYSQGELADFGKKQEESKAPLSDLLQFVNPAYKQDDDRLATEIELAQNGVRAAIQALANHWATQAKLRKLTTSRDSLSQRILALEKTLPALSDGDKEITAAFERANQFESKRLQASKHANQIVQEVNAIATELLNQRDLTAETTPNAAAVQQAYGDLFKAFQSSIGALQAELKVKREAMEQAEEKWGKTFAQSKTDRDGVLEKFSAHKTATTQIRKLREEMDDLTNAIGDVEAGLQAETDPSEALGDALRTLREASIERANQTEAWAREIETLSTGKIKARVEINGDVSEIFDAVNLVAAKTGSKETTRAQELRSALENSSVADLLDRLRSDCLALLYWRQVGAANGDEPPKCEDLMRMLGDTDRIRKAVTELMDTGRVEQIAVAIAKPNIDLSYCDGSKEISFDKASEGQRAAALLFLLLEQEGGPLLIDQPEGDLDNKIITDLTDKLHSAKQHRQLLFASHNANIVVNGSSEFVGYLDVREDGDRLFHCIGAIDKEDICQVITSTMEGGEKAFKDRQQKYGY